MEKVPDWAALWRELAEMHVRGYRRQQPEDGGDSWRAKAKGFDAKVKRRWATSTDSSRELIVAHLKAHPGATILDIGAGTGAWAVLLARHARHVTAVEPSAAMIDVMQENLAAEGIANVTIVQGTWPDAAVEEHDFSLCSHAMYGCPDLPAFVRRMEEVTRRTCHLLLRVPIAGSLMAKLAAHVLGQPYDSTDFQVAYNVLLQMGIYADVQMEDSGLWDPWQSATLEEALADVKRRFGLEENSPHDAYLVEMLRQHLTYEDGCYIWPRGVRSALVYWSPAER